MNKQISWQPTNAVWRMMTLAAVAEVQVVDDDQTASSVYDHASKRSFLTLY